jgi:dipeptidyl aminopeptidase/acylaminoacyl peptidase
MPREATMATVSPGGAWATYCVTPADSVVPVVADTTSTHGFEADSMFGLYSGLPTQNVRLHPHPSPVCWIEALGASGRTARRRIALPESTTVVGPPGWLRNGDAFILDAYDGSYLGEGVAANTGFAYYGSVARPSLDRTTRHYRVDAATGRIQVVNFGAGLNLSLDEARAVDRVEDSGRVTMLVITSPSRREERRVAVTGDTVPLFVRIDGWEADNHTVVLSANDATFLGINRERVLAVDVRNGTSRELCARELRDYGQIHIARDGRHAVAVGVRPGELPQIYAVDFAERAPTPRALVARGWLNPQLATAPPLGYDTITWHTTDGKYQLGGHLILPPAFDRHRQYPLVVCQEGGPSPSPMDVFQPCVNGPLAVFAARGYVVLIPNIRNVSESVNLRDRSGYLLPGFRDLMAGLDVLFKRYPIDSTRMGILGFSYGGIFTSFAITHTNRFRAAYIGEGTMEAPVWYLNLLAVQDTARIVWGAQLGFVGPHSDPWNPVDRAIDDSSTAIYYADRVLTPNLVESGVYPLTPFAGGAWFWSMAMRRFGVPEEWWLYPRSGHGWHDLSMSVESYDRILAWFDYWLRGAPYPDVAKQKRYDEWIRVRKAAGDPRWAHSLARE